LEIGIQIELSLPSRKTAVRNSDCGKNRKEITQPPTPKDSVEFLDQ